MLICFFLLLCLLAVNWRCNVNRLLIRARVDRFRLTELVFPCQANSSNSASVRIVCVSNLDEKEGTMFQFKCSPQKNLWHFIKLNGLQTQCVYLLWFLLLYSTNRKLNYIENHKDLSRLNTIFAKSNEFQIMPTDSGIVSTSSNDEIKKNRSLCGRPIAIFNFAVNLQNWQFIGEIKSTEKKLVVRIFFLLFFLRIFQIIHIYYA